MNYAKVRKEALLCVAEYTCTMFKKKKSKDFEWRINFLKKENSKASKFVFLKITNTALSSRENKLLPSRLMK